MNILVTGAAGMLGQAIKEVFADHNLICTDIEELDVRYAEEVKKFSHCGAELILHLAAKTDLEECQRFPEQAYFTNHTGSLNMRLLAKTLDIPIVYIGTAGIFDGKQDYYVENDIPNPANNYGCSKFYGELAIKVYKKHYIFRNGWSFGGGPEHDKKFVNKIYKQIKGGAKIIYAINEIFGSPTYTVDLAKTIKEAVIERKIPYGIYNAAGLLRASRFDVAIKIVEILGLKDQVKVLPVGKDYFKKDYDCPRVVSEVLDDTKLISTKASCMRAWPYALEEYLKKEFINK